MRVLLLHPFQGKDIKNYVKIIKKKGTTQYRKSYL